MTARDPTRVTQLLRQFEAGDDVDAAAEELLPLVYDELRAIAGTLMREERAGHTLQPTALVHEAFVRLSGQDEVRWAGRVHFKATAARAMRRLLINHARDRAAQKRGGSGRAMVTLDEALAKAAERDVDVLALEEARKRLAALSPRQAALVELRFYGGLTFDEAAKALGVGVTTAKGDWVIARAWLARELSSKDRS